MNINQRGIYTVLEMNESFTILLLYRGEAEAKELRAKFISEQHADNFMKMNGSMVQKATNQAFQMARQSQKMMYS